MAESGGVIGNPGVVGEIEWEMLDPWSSSSIGVGCWWWDTRLRRFRIVRPAASSEEEWSSESEHDPPEEDE